MELLYKIFEFIMSILTWAPSTPDGVTVAIGPLAIMAISGGIGLGKHLLGAKERNRLKDRTNRSENRMESIQRALGGDIASLKDRANAIDTDMSAEELYGQSIQSLTDRAMAGQAGASGQIAKSLAAGGGDLSGSMSATLQRLTSSTNRSIQDIMNQYNERADRRNLQQASRKDNLLNSALGARQNQYSGATNQFNLANSRQTQKSTADKQFFMDLLGTGANVASTVSTANTAKSAAATAAAGG